MQINIPELDQIFQMIQSLNEKVDQLSTANSIQNSIGQYLTRKEAAAAIGVSMSTVSNWAREGLINKYGHGRTVRYKLEELKAVLEG